MRHVTLLGRLQGGGGSVLCVLGWSVLVGPSVVCVGPRHAPPRRAGPSRLSCLQGWSTLWWCELVEMEVWAGVGASAQRRRVSLV